MVTRREDSRFMGGALVFPGGRVDPADLEAAPTWPQFDDAASRLAAIRELFEETGFLLVGEPGASALLPADRALAAVERWRKPVHDGEATLEQMLAAESLAPALDRLTFFAHWVTPEERPMRFDTRFYAAAAPGDQLGRHDGTELVSSRWVTPAQAIAEADEGQVLLAFPTRLNLMLIAGAPNAAAALATLAAREVETVTPRLVDTVDGPRLYISASAGYAVTQGRRP